MYGEFEGMESGGLLRWSGVVEFPLKTLDDVLASNRYPDFSVCHGRQRTAVREQLGQPVNQLLSDERKVIHRVSGWFLLDSELG